MVKKLVKTNVRPMSVTAILVGLAILIAINLLSRFTEFNLTPFHPDILTLIGAIFILSEVGAMQMFGKRSRMRGVNVILDWLIVIVGVLAILGVALNWLSIPAGFLNPYQGLVELGLLVFVFIEIFRKN